MLPFYHNPFTLCRYYITNRLSQCLHIEGTSPLAPRCSLTTEYTVIDEPDYEWLMIDAGHIKVHPHASGAKGGNQDMCRTKGGSTPKYIRLWFFQYQLLAFHILPVFDIWAQIQYSICISISNVINVLCLYLLQNPPMGAKGGNQDMSRTKGGSTPKYIRLWMRMVCQSESLLQKVPAGRCGSSSAHTLSLMSCR